MTRLVCLEANIISIGDFSFFKNFVIFLKKKIEKFTEIICKE
jgi:hypothetical protein